MSRHTPWIKPSSLASDRIKPKGGPNVAQPKSKGKTKQTAPDTPPKSALVRRFEALLKAVESTNGTERDPAGGCFCLAREHSLSTYTPICTSCGFILCSINPPHLACPSCTTPLLKPAARETLQAQLAADLATQLDKEERERERALEEAQRAVGAFPSLSGAPPPVATVAHPQPVPAKQTHKVMSLTGARRGGVLVSSYTTTPVSSRPVSRTDSPASAAEVEEKVHRVPPPPNEPPYAKSIPGKDRPWENLLDEGEALLYCPPARVGEGKDDAASGPGRKRRRGKGGAKDSGSNLDAKGGT